MPGFSSVFVRAATVGIALTAAVTACSGGGGGGNYQPNPAPTLAPTATPTAAPTSCASPTAAPASGAAVFYLAPDCAAAASDRGSTVAGDANGTLVLASTADESLVLASGATQTAPPATTLEVTITPGESASARRRSPARSVRLFAPRPVARRALHPHLIANRKLARLLAASTRHGAGGARTPSILPASVGSTAGIWTLVQSGSGDAYAQVPSTLEYASTYGDIWVDDTLLATNGGPLSTTAIEQIGTDYDNAHAAVTPVFGSPDYTATSNGAQETTDCTGQSTPIFIADSDDRQAVFVISSASNGGFGSYFDPANLLENDVATTCVGAESNERSGIYLQYNVGSGADSQSQQLGEDDLVLGANDLTHLVDFVGHTITGPGAQNASYLSTGYIDTPFILEGLASLSEDFAVHRAYPNVALDVDDNLASAQTYLANTPDYELTAFYGADPGGSPGIACDGCFGSAYLFARYAYDRFGPSYPTVLVNSGLTGFAELASAFGSSTSPQNVIGDFAVAMEASGEHLSTDPRFNVAGFTTYGNFTDQFGEALALTGPNVAATQSTGTVTYPATEGAFLYVGLGGLPAAETIETTDGSNGAFGLETALSQH